MTLLLMMMHSISVAKAFLFYKVYIYCVCVLDKYKLFLWKHPAYGQYIRHQDKLKLNNCNVRANNATDWENNTSA